VRLVLDTNVVIDWLVFDDPYMAAFREAVLRHQVTVLTHSHALEELQRVLAYRALKLDVSRQSLILRQYREQTVVFPEGEAAAQADVPKGFPRCRDPDDAPFLTLAWRSRADALVSRDNEVLALKRRATKFGFQILNVPEMMDRVVALSARRNDLSGRPAA
jgi:uncharacterized protein